MSTKGAVETGRSLNLQEQQVSLEEAARARSLTITKVESNDLNIINFY